MFSGITQGLFTVVDVKREKNLLTYAVKLSPPLCKNLTVGNSIAIDGVCQTVIFIQNNIVTLQAITETLTKTTLNTLCPGQKVSVERSLKAGDEIGGHMVSGHIHGTGIIDDIVTDVSTASDKSITIRIKCDPLFMKYILEKGFIAIDGSSLTIGKTSPAGFFTLYIIPETLRLTNFPNKNLGDKVNIEIDQQTKSIVDTLEKLLPNMLNNL